MFEKGEQLICQYEDWYNAHGEKCYKLNMGQKLIVKSMYRLAGMMFIKFEEFDDEYGFLSTGFKRMLH